MTNETIRVFIGSGEASLLERKTLIHTLREHSDRVLDICVFNGSHNAVERGDAAPEPAPMSLRVKYRSYTEFSLYRFLIPELCNHRGRAIYLDSDILALGEIGELFDAPMDGLALRVRPGAYRDGGWATSVMLLDCARCHFDLEQIVDEIEAGLYSYRDFTRLLPAYLEQHPLRIGALEERWNSFDHCTPETKLLHYTNLRSQPWKYPGHPLEKLWLQHFLSAQAAGVLPREDVERTVQRGYARPELLRAEQLMRPRRLRRLLGSLANGRPPRAEGGPR